MRFRAARKLMREHAVVLAVLTAVAGALVVPAVVLATPAAASTMGGRITWQEVESRVQYWVDHPPPNGYDPSATEAGPTGEPYRTDCSGFVSLALHLDNANGGPNTKEMKDNGQFEAITKDDLRPGDVMDKPFLGADGHVVLFAGWKDDTHTSYYGYEFGTGSAPVRDEIPYPYYPKDNPSAFVPLRYKNLVTTGTAAEPMAAMESNTNTLFSYGSQGAVDQRQGMQGGTDPAITRLANGDYETAFVANTGMVQVRNRVGTDDLGLRAATGTSPAIAHVGTGFVVAYHAISSTLHVWDSRTGKDLDTHLGMMANTNPSVAGNGNAYQAVMQSNVGELFTFTSTVAGKGTGAHTHQGMAHNSSPAVAPYGKAYEIAFRANTGALVFHGAVHLTTSQAVATGTSPAVTTVGSRSIAAFQDPSAVLVVASSSGGGATNLGQGMRAGTSPAIATFGTAYETAFQSNTGELVLHGGTGHLNTHLGMHTATAPSLA